MTDAERYSGILRYTATAIDPIHHGAGTEGNTQLLRTQDVMLADGTPTRVPFVSGNSIKHMIRDGGVRFALEVMRVQNGTLTKPVVDLLFSGGALTKSGSAVNLERAREIAGKFPILSLCGYSAGNFMQESKINVSHLHLVCAENAYRIPPALADDPQAKNRAMAARAEEFGTRHEPTKNPAVFGMLINEHREEQLKALAVASKGKDKKKKTQQMVYDFEVVRPGTKWFGDIIFDDLSQMELVALRSALERACVERRGDGLLFHIGAKSSVGMGRMVFEFNGGLREELSTPSFSPNEAIVPMNGNTDRDTMAAYVEYLRDHHDDIIKVLEEVV